MNKIISFSIWGDKGMYTAGLLKNIELIQVIYPGWKVYVYYDKSVPEKIISEIRSSGAECRDMTNSGIYGMFWRFLANDENQDGYTIFRDADSRVSRREKLAVDEWIKSGKTLHVMRDHPAHAIPHGASKPAILGGMWGIKAGKIKLKDDIKKVNEHPLGYGSDQTFLESLYDKFQNDMFVHDEFNCGKPFPVKRDNYHFIGERFNENDERFEEDYITIKNYYKSRELKTRIKRYLARLFN